MRLLPFIASGAYLTSAASFVRDWPNHNQATPTIARRSPTEQGTSSSPSRRQSGNTDVNGLGEDAGSRAAGRARSPHRPISSQHAKVDVRVTGPARINPGNRLQQGEYIRPMQVKTVSFNDPVKAAANVETKTEAYGVSGSAILAASGRKEAKAGVWVERRGRGKIQGISPQSAATRVNEPFVAMENKFAANWRDQAVKVQSSIRGPGFVWAEGRNSSPPRRSPSPGP